MTERTETKVICQFLLHIHSFSDLMLLVW